MKKTVLPMTNGHGYYEIRLESIGGLGANLCGKMLGELGVRILGVNSVSFSSYGSEKTGTPVKAYIRYCDADKEIRIHAPIQKPHLLCVFHEALLRDEKTVEGCTEDTVVLINTGSDKTAERLGGMKAVYMVPAQQIAMETHARINVVMLGALARVSGFIPLEAVEEICQKVLGAKYPDALAGNLAGIVRGYQEVQKQEAVTQQPGAMQKEQSDQPEEARKELLYREPPLGGIITQAGNIVTNDLAPSRQGYIPVFIKERCINCGLCDSTCPDMVFQFAKGIYQGKERMVNQGLDYYHCKGCMRCVAVCPTQALVKGLEAEHPQKKWFLPNQELLRKPIMYDAAGADGYITSESYLTEKRIDGGEV